LNQVTAAKSILNIQINPAIHYLELQPEAANTIMNCSVVVLGISRKSIIVNMFLKE